MSRRNVPGLVYLLCLRNADGSKAWLAHAGHYTGKAASSGLLKGLWPADGRELAGSRRGELSPPR